MKEHSSPLNQVTIRKAGESDLPGIARLKSRLDRLHRLLGLWPPEGDRRQQLLRYRKLVRQPVSRLFVAERSSHDVVGYLTAFVENRNCDQKEFRRIGVIGETFVQERYRNRGIGTSLVGAAMRFFSSEGIRNVSLRNAVGNESANRFWGRLGFNPVLYTRTATLEEIDKSLRNTGKPAFYGKPIVNAE